MFSSDGKPSRSMMDIRSSIQGKAAPCPHTGRQRFFDRILREVPRLRRYARILLIDPDRADRLVTTCLEQAVHARRQLPPGIDLRLWLFRLLRRNYCMAAAPQISALLPKSSFERAGTAIPDAFFNLSDDHREILLLLIMEQMSESRVAAITESTTDAVRSRLKQARCALAHGLKHGQGTGAAGFYS